jgi:hypothetical protein
LHSGRFAIHIALVRRFLIPALLLLLLLSGIWSAWQWLRPYETGNASNWKVRQVTVKRDHGHAWVDIELSNPSRKTISCPPLSRLVDARQTKKEPADTRISADGQTCQIRYWLEWQELESAWSLQLEDHTLRIKEACAIPLANGQGRSYRQPRW